MSDDIANTKLDELREKAKANFSEDEIDNFIQVGKKLAAKPVLSALISLLKEGPDRGYSEVESKSLIKKVTKLIPYDYCGFVSLGFRETSMKLNICLSLVEDGYRTEISIPSNDYVRSLFEQYDFLKQTAIAYWRQFVSDQPKLFEQICAYMKDVDFTNLMINVENPTVLFWDPKSKKKIGLFCYYVDASNRPWYKKTSRNSTKK